jgi:hypothetical protein
MTKCKIVTADGRVFAKSDWPVMALRVNARRRILWPATGWLAHCQQCDAADRDKSALLAFHLDSGALLKRVDSPVKGLLGDMTISRAGDLFVSEGSYGAVLRLKGAPQPWSVSMHPVNSARRRLRRFPPMSERSTCRITCAALRRWT